MANWYGSARSNYFRVKDITKFEELCRRWNVTFIRKEGKPDLVGFLCDGSPGGLPNYRYEEPQSEEEDTVLKEHDFDDFLKELSSLLVDGDVAVMLEVGAEKLSYVTGFALALNSRGDKVALSLGDIYEMAKGLVVI